MIELDKVNLNASLPDFVRDLSQFSQVVGNHCDVLVDKVVDDLRSPTGITQFYQHSASLGMKHEGESFHLDGAQLLQLLTNASKPDSKQFLNRSQ